MLINFAHHMLNENLNEKHKLSSINVAYNLNTKQYQEGTYRHETKIIANVAIVVICIVLTCYLKSMLNCLPLSLLFNLHPLNPDHVQKTEKERKVIVNRTSSNSLR